MISVRSGSRQDERTVPTIAQIRPAVAMEVGSPRSRAWLRPMYEQMMPAMAIRQREPPAQDWRQDRDDAVARGRPTTIPGCPAAAADLTAAEGAGRGVSPVGGQEPAATPGRGRLSRRRRRSAGRGGSGRGAAGCRRRRRWRARRRRRRPCGGGGAAAAAAVPAAAVGRRRLTERVPGRPVGRIGHCSPLRARVGDGLLAEVIVEAHPGFCDRASQRRLILR
jgi:hypothetical protein